MAVKVTVTLTAEEFDQVRGFLGKADAILRKDLEEVENLINTPGDVVEINMDTRELRESIKRQLRQLNHLLNETFK